VQRYEAKKEEKRNKIKEDNIKKELSEVKPTPMLDELSSQIVEMMEDRKGVDTKERLY